MALKCPKNVDRLSRNKEKCNLLNKNDAKRMIIINLEPDIKNSVFTSFSIIVNLRIIIKTIY